MRLYLISAPENIARLNAIRADLAKLRRSARRGAGGARGDRGAHAGRDVDQRERARQRGAWLRGGDADTVQSRGLQRSRHARGDEEGARRAEPEHESRWPRAIRGVVQLRQRREPRSGCERARRAVVDPGALQSLSLRHESRRDGDDAARAARARARTAPLAAAGRDRSARPRVELLLPAHVGGVQPAPGRQLPEVDGDLRQGECVGVRCARLDVLLARRLRFLRAVLLGHVAVAHGRHRHDVRDRRRRLARTALSPPRRHAALESRRHRKALHHRVRDLHDHGREQGRAREGLSRLPPARDDAKGARSR